MAVHLNSANSAQGFALEQVTCLLRTVTKLLQEQRCQGDVQSTFLRTQYVKRHIVLFCSLGWKFTAFRQLEGVLALYRK